MILIIRTSKCVLPYKHVSVNALGMLIVYDQLLSMIIDNDEAKRFLKIPLIK